MEQEIISRVKDWLNNKPTPPYQIEINPTNKCNLNCLHCQARGKKEYKSGEEEKITNRIYKRIIREASDLGVKKIHLSGGGEPLISQKIYKIIKQIKKNRITGSLVTNGTLFEKKIIKKMIKLGWDNILYSIDGPNAEIHDYIRNQEGTFDRAIKSIKTFNLLKEKLKKDKPRIEMCLVLNSYNYNKIKEYIHLACFLNIKKIFIQPIRVNKDQLGKKFLLDNNQKKEFNNSIKSLLKEANKFNIETNLNEFDNILVEKSSHIDEIIGEYMDKKKDIASLPCYSPWYFMGIRPNGDVYPCGVDSSKPFGNILYNSLRDIWFGKAFNNFRKKLLKKKLPSFCKECCGMTVMITKDIQDNLS